MKIAIEITSQRIADLMVSAIEGNHMTRAWCSGIILVRHEQKFTDIAVSALESVNKDPWYANPNLYDGSAFVIDIREQDEETGKITSHMVTPDHFAAGLTLMATKYGRHFGDFMAENDDNITADVFLQCVALRDVVYG
jgi:hypothetical protein